MGRPELGAKCTCTWCHERFYDLNRSPAVCPKCGAQQPPERPREPRAQRVSFGSGTFGAGPKPRQRSAAAVTIDDDVEPTPTPDVEDESDAPEADDEADDDIEVDPDLDKAVD